MKIAVTLVSILFVVLVLMVLGFFYAFPQTQIVHANVHLSFKDEKGQVLAKQAVSLWEYDHYSQNGMTNEEGKVEFANQSFQVGKLFFEFWKKRPEVFSIRLRLPEINKLYYRFEVEKDGPVEYQVFNDSYDYFFGEKWLGTFNNQSQIAKSVTEGGQVYQATSPDNTCQCVPLWKADAKIKKSGENLYDIYIDLQQSGVWNFSK